MVPPLEATSETPIPVNTAKQFSKIAISEKGQVKLYDLLSCWRTKRMVNANGFTKRPITSMGIKLYIPL